MADLPADLPNLSLHQVFRRLPRERLQLHPLLWTPRHLDLLRCAFVPQRQEIEMSPSAPAPSWRRPLGAISINAANSPDVVPRSPGKPLAIQHQPSPETHTTTPPAPNQSLLARSLCRAHAVAVKEAAIVSLLSDTFVKAKSSDHCTLHFETHKVYLSCLVLVSAANSTQHKQPDVHIAYLDASKIQSARQKYLKLACWATSDATHAIYTTRLTRLVPKAGANDPYIVAMLIALAQRQQSMAATTSISKAHVLLSDVENKSHLLVYTADIPKTFVDKISCPRDQPSPTATFQISTDSIPYKPHETFQQRLAEALSPPKPKRTRGEHETEEARPLKRRV